MNPSIVQKQIRQNHIREGLVYKRSKFLKQWQQRWMILTKNYIYLYQDKSKKSMTDSIDLKQIKNYKSYVRKEQDVITSCLKIRSDDNMYYLSFTSISEKWSWMVTLERLMDFKISGNSVYNSEDWIKVKGFSSQVEFANKKHLEIVSLSTDTNDYKKERDQLKKKLVDQEKFYERQLKEKYQKLNSIEVSMLEKKKSYEQLIQKHEQEEKKFEKTPSNTQISQSSVTNSIQQSKPVQDIFKNLFASAPVENIEDKQQIPLKQVTKMQQINIFASNRHSRSSIPALSEEISQLLIQITESNAQRNIVDAESVNEDELEKELELLKQKLKNKLEEIKKQIEQPNQAQNKEVVVHELKAIQEEMARKIRQLEELNHSLQAQNRILKEQNRGLYERLKVLQKVSQKQSSPVQNITAPKQQKVNAKSATLYQPYNKKIQIHQSHKLSLVQSLIGYTPLNQQQSSLYIDIDIITQKKIIPFYKAPKIDEKRNLMINQVQTMLGFSIPSQQYGGIHTEGHMIKREQLIEVKIQANSIIQSSSIQKPQLKPVLRQQQVILPSVSLKIRQENKIHLLESILGYTITKKEEGDLLLRAEIIPFVLPKNEVIQQKIETSTENYEKFHKIYEVQTILGYSVSPSNYKAIHTLGNIQKKAESKKEIIKSIPAEHRIESKYSQNTTKSLIIEDQKPKIQSPKKQNSQLQTSIERSQVIIEREAIKPSLIKHASTKNDETPVWVKHKQIAQSQKLQSEPEMIRRVSSGLVSNMKNLFQSKTIQTKQSQKRQSNIYTFKKQ